MGDNLEGGVLLHVCGEPRRLRLGWAALAELRRDFGSDFQNHIVEALSSYDFEVTARIIALATDNAVSQSDVLADSPAILPAIRAVHAALVRANHGPNGPPKEKPRPLAMALEGARAILFKIRLMLGWRLAAI